MLSRMGLGLAIVASFLVPNLAQAKGVQGIQMDPVAIPMHVSCNRILFRSTQAYKNTAFAVPRVIPGANPTGTNAYQIVPNPKEPGTYNLYVRLYFPANDEVLKGPTAAKLNRDQQNCNWDAVKFAINKDLNEKEQIKNITPSPLTSIELHIRGIEDVGRIGRVVGSDEDVDIIHYNSAMRTAIFQITEVEKEYFQSLVVTALGTPVIVKLNFKAISRDGSVRATVDVDAFKANFSAAAEGKTAFGAADVKATLEKSKISQVVSIVTEASTSRSLEKVEAMIIEKVMKEVNIKVAEATKAETAKASGDGKISLSMITDIIMGTFRNEISFQNMSANETASASTEIAIKSIGIPDPNIVPIELKAKYPDVSSGFSVRKGESVSIAAAFTYVDEIKHIDRDTDLTLGQIEELGLHRHFPDLTARGMSVENMEVNGHYMAIGLKRGLGGYSPIKGLRTYKWVRTERYENRVRTESSRLKLSAEEYAKLPITLSFSAFGERNLLDFADLLANENPELWTARYDHSTRRIVLTAHQDLGVIRFGEDMANKDDVAFYDDPVVTDSVVQIDDLGFGLGPNKSQPVVLRSDYEALKLQRTYVLNVTRPRPAEANDLLRASVKP